MRGEIKKRKFLVFSNAFLTNLIFGHKTGRFREALVAEKAKKTIAPLLERELGRKPHIGIVFGAGHTGIVKMLRNPTARRRALSRVNLRSIKDAADIVGKVMEVKRNPKTHRLVAKFIETGIIPPKFRPVRWRARAYYRLGKKKIKSRLARKKPVP